MLTAQFTCLAGAAVQEFAQKQKKNIAKTNTSARTRDNGRDGNKFNSTENNTKREKQDEKIMITKETNYNGKGKQKRD